MKNTYLWLYFILLLNSFSQCQIINTLRGWEEPEQGLSAQLEGGITLARGNTQHLNFRAGGSLQLLTGRHRIRFMISEVYHTASGEKVAEDFKVHLRHNYSLSELMSTLLFLQDQYNPFRRIESRALFGGGMRMDILRDSSRSAALGGSVMLEAVRLTGSDQRSTDVRGSFFISLIWKPAPGSVIDLSGFYQPLMPGFDEPLLMAALNLEASLFTGLSIFTDCQLSYDSQPPDSVESTDLSITSGLRFSI